MEAKISRFIEKQINQIVILDIIITFIIKFLLNLVLKEN